MPFAFASGLLVDQQLHAQLARHAVAQGVHVAELPGGVDVQQRERRRRRVEGLRARCSITALSLPMEYSITGPSASATTSRRMWMLSASRRCRWVSRVGARAAVCRRGGAGRLGRGRGVAAPSTPAVPAEGPDRGGQPLARRRRRAGPLPARARGGALANAGSSLKLCLLAAGEADLYPRLGRTMEWDIAAGHAVLAAAGGGVLTLDGAPFGYGKPGFENPHFVAPLRDDVVEPVTTRACPRGPAAG
jgi:hypothetical protein